MPFVKLRCEEGEPPLEVELPDSVTMDEKQRKCFTLQNVYYATYHDQASGRAVHAVLKLLDVDDYYDIKFVRKEISMALWGASVGLGPVVFATHEDFDRDRPFAYIVSERVIANDSAAWGGLVDEYVTDDELTEDPDEDYNYVDYAAFYNKLRYYGLLYDNTRGNTGVRADDPTRLLIIDWGGARFVDAEKADEEYTETVERLMERRARADANRRARFANRG